MGCGRSQGGFHTARLERGTGKPLRCVLGRIDTLGLIM